jgi:formylmethanofuran dehydrogenase subunit E
MGLGTGIECERCGEQVYNDGHVNLKEQGDDHNLCSVCIKEMKKADWDNNNPDYEQEEK